MTNCVTEIKDADVIFITGSNTSEAHPVMGMYVRQAHKMGKKIIVATEVSKGLKLNNVKTVNARAESLPETFDYIVSRAVTSLENFMPWVKGKYNEGILYLKGGDLTEEIAKARLRKGSVHIWPISGWTSDPFFETKQVIFIEK